MKTTGRLEPLAMVAAALSTHTATAQTGTTVQGYRGGFAYGMAATRGNLPRPAQPRSHSANAKDF